MGENEPTRSPLVEHLLAALTKRIQDGTYRSGQRLPTERMLATEFGVSRMVVRAAVQSLARDGYARLAARCRPIAVRQRSSERRSTAPASRHTFALWLTHQPTEVEVPSLLYGIQRRLDHDSHRLIVDNAAGDSHDSVVESEARFLRRLTEDQDIAGAILWYAGGTTNLPALLYARRHGIPLVFLDRRPPTGFEADHVGVDNEAAAEAAVRHLVEAGHSRIAHITNIDPASTVAERKAGYRMAMEATGLPWDPRLVLQATGRHSEMNATCRRLVDEMTGLHNPPTAVFCVNDRLAFGMIEALRDRGLRVPQDIAVAGFDGIERWMPGTAFLTTCRQPFERIGWSAIDLLLRRIEIGSCTSYRYVLLDAPLFLGASTKGRRPATAGPPG